MNDERISHRDFLNVIQRHLAAVAVNLVVSFVVYST